MNEHRGLWRGKHKAYYNYEMGQDVFEWVEGHYVSNGKDLHYIITDKFVQRLVDHSTLGECTCVPDKNGKLIFEGDILKAIWQHLGNKDTVIGIVKYDNAAFFLETDDHYLFFEDNIFSAECEVIGNIHDNTELILKGAADNE